MFEDQNDPVAFLDKNGDAYTTTLIIAEGTGIEHKAVIQLVRTYTTDLEEFGRVAFQMEPFVTAGGTQRREIAILNEPQAALIMTYMRNNEVVREFKKRLVKSFYTLTHQPAKLATTGSHSIFITLNCPGKDGELGELDKLEKLTTAICNSTQALEKLTAQLAIANQQHKEVTQAKPQQPTPALVAFLNAWWDCLADRNLLASDICRIVNSQQCPALTQAVTTLFNLAGKNLTSKKLGTSLRLWLQQDLNDFCILNTGNRIKGSIVWRLERT